MARYQTDDDFGNEPLTLWQAYEAVREAAAYRRFLVSVGDMQATLGLAQLELGRKFGQPHLERRCVATFLKASTFYARAGLGRRSAACERLANKRLRVIQDGYVPRSVREGKS